MDGKAMRDVQSSPSEVRLALDRVGVKNFRLPLVVRDKAKGRQSTVAQVDLYVDLPAKFKGTHMSRFIEALSDWSGILDYHSFKALLEDVRKRLQARRAHMRFAFPYFIERPSPVTAGASGLMDYQCALSGDLENSVMTFTLQVETPVMTVCPCSLAISEQGAHSQRAVVRTLARSDGMVWIEEIVEIAQKAASSPVYPLLKRRDEKFVTEEAFRNPTFVEDVVRNAAHSLMRHPRVTWFRVEVESFESIHNHSAFASFEHTVESAAD